MATFTPVKLLIDTVNDSQVSISNTAGGQVWLPIATTSTGGMITGSDKAKLDALSSPPTQNFISSGLVIFTHNLNKYPSINVQDSAGTNWEVEVKHHSLAQCQVDCTKLSSGIITAN